MVRALPPWFENLKKRQVKSPKILLRDSGLLHSLLGISDRNELLGHPKLGASWEGFIIEQTLGTLAAIGKQAQAYFFRTSDGYELDLVLDWGVERWAVEIKLTSDPSSDMIGRLHKAADMIDAARRVLVCRIARKIETDTLLVTNLSGWLQRLQAHHT